MGIGVIAEEGFPQPQPAFGKYWFDNVNNQWYQRNGSGIFLGDMSGATIAQIAAHSADTYYKGLKLPSFGIQVNTVFEWAFPVTKGAAGTAAPAYIIRIGPNQTTADTARLTLNGAAQTAAADSGIVVVRVICRTIGAAGILRGSIHLQHNLAATGFANTPAGFNLVEASSAGFDNQQAAMSGQFVGLSVNPGASGAWVVEQVIQKIFF